MLAPRTSTTTATTWPPLSLTKPAVCAPIDANGNLTADGTKSYSWNALNQLVEVKEGSTTLATFEYDGEGRRTEKVAAGLTHQYIYDAEDIVEERISGSTSDTIRYYHGAGIDEPLAKTNGSSATTYYLADHLGSIVQETSSSGSVLLDREYDAWGEPLGADSSGYAFTGRERDAEIGLYYYRARYYDTRGGRFIGQDPVGLLGGINLTAYVSNSPTTYVDSFGLCGEEQDRAEPARRNNLDQLYGDLVRRQAPTVLDEAIPGIAKRAKPMGELDTYFQLAMYSVIGAALTNPGANTAVEMSVSYVATLAPRAFNVLSNIGQSLIPVMPTGAIQIASAIAQRSPTVQDVINRVWNWF